MAKHKKFLLYKVKSILLNEVKVFNGSFAQLKIEEVIFQIFKVGRCVQNL